MKKQSSNKSLSNIRRYVPHSIGLVVKGYLTLLNKFLCASLMYVPIAFRKTLKPVFTEFTTSSTNHAVFGISIDDYVPC